MNAGNRRGRTTLGPAGSFKETLRDTGMDAVCCILMSIGLLLSFDELFRFHAALPAMIVHVILFTAAFVLLTRRAWLLLAAAGGAVLLFLLFGLLSGGALFNWAAGFLEWWRMMFPSRSPYNTAGNIALVQLLVQLGIVGLFYFSIRLIRSVWIIGSAALFYYAVVASFGFTERMLPSILLLLIGLFSLLARNYFPLPGGRLRLLVSVHKLQAAALAIGGVCCLLAWALLPPSTADWRILDTDMHGTHLRDPSGNSIGKIIPSDLYTVGLQPEMDRLGGNISLNDTTPVMRVKADLPYLMRGNVYDEYTGSGWSAADLAAYGWNAGDQAAEKAFGRYLPAGGAEAMWLYQSVFPKRDAEVTMLRRNSTLFAFGLLQDLELRDGGSPFYNERGEIFADSVLYPNDSYYFTALVNQRLGDNAENFDLLATQLTQSIVYGDPYYKEISQVYTALPQLPARVRAAAREAAGEEESPYLQATRLMDYLKNGEFRYTLTPGSVPKDRDFVDYFLETKQGYCTYFASAMTVMARSLGIPARLVSGYGLQYRDGDGSWVALQKNAHAWVECYFYGIGWITFDPTAGVPYGDPAGEPLPGPVASGGMTTQPAAPSTAPSGGNSSRPASTTAPGGVTTPSAPSGQGGETLPGWATALLILSAAVVLLLLLLLWRIHRHTTIYRLDWVRRRFEDNAARAAHYYTDMLHQAALLGYTPETGETLLRFVTRMAGDDTIPDQAVREAFGIVMDWKYGEHPPADEDLVRMAAAHDALEACLRRRLKAVPYFFRRVLLG